VRQHRRARPHGRTAPAVAQGIHPGIRQQLINIAQLLKRRADEARAEVPDIDTMSQKTDELLAGIETSLKRRKRAEAIAIPIR